MFLILLKYSIISGITLYDLLYVSVYLCCYKTYYYLAFTYFLFRCSINAYKELKYTYIPQKHL